MIFFYRDEKFTLPEPDSKLKRGDEVMIITPARISKNRTSVGALESRLRAQELVQFGRLPCPFSLLGEKAGETHSDRFWSTLSL